CAGPPFRPSWQGLRLASSRPDFLRPRPGRHHPLNVTSPVIAPEAVVLSSQTLAVEQDVVSLCRRIRLAAEQVGLDDRSTRSLSAAAYQAGRMLLAPDAPAQADLRIAESALQVQVTAAPGDAPDTRRSIRRALEPLRSLVDRLAIADAGR